MKHQAEPEPKRVTITIDSPDEDGLYLIRVKVAEDPWVSEYSSEDELAEILPDSKEVKEWLQ